MLSLIHILTALHDKSDGFFRRQIVLTTKDRPAGSADDPFPVSYTHLDLGRKAGLQVITTDPTEVFTEQVGHLPGLNVGDQAFPARTLQIAARPSIIRIVDNVCLLYTSRCV